MTEQGGSDDETRQREPPPMIQPTAGVSPDIAALLQMMQANQAAADKRMEKMLQNERQEREAAERRQERVRKEDQQEQQQAMRLLIDQMATISNSNSGKPRTPTVRLPVFDIDKDAKSFPQWKSRWETYVKANKLHTIEDPEERNERQMGDLKAALTDNTLRWLTYREMPPADKSNPDMVLKQMEDHIKDSINPIVTVIELVTLKRYPNETADHLNARINEKLGQCDFTGVTDIRDYIGLIATIQSCDVQLRKRMFYDKVNTHAKAALAVKAEEQATSHSKMLSEDTAQAHATSSYKREQNHERQQPNQNSNQFRTQSRGQSHSRGRGGHHNSQRQERGRSQSRSRPDQRSESHQRSDSQNKSGQKKACYRCGKTNHDSDDCWFKEKPCLNCDKIGHIAPVCRQPKRTNASSSQATGQSNAVEAMLKAVTASAQGTIAKTSGTLASKYPPPQPLDTIDINFQFMQQGSKSFTLTILPDTGANITALDISQAKGIALEDTTVKIKVANGTNLQVLGTAEATISRHGNQADELIYIVKDL